MIKILLTKFETDCTSSWVMGCQLGNNRMATKIPGPHSPDSSLLGHLNSSVYHTRPRTTETTTDITSQASERVRCTVQHPVNRWEQQEGHHS